MRRGAGCRAGVAVILLAVLCTGTDGRRTKHSMGDGKGQRRHRPVAQAMAGETQLHHLFSTPVLIVNMTSRGVDAAALSELALDGFKRVADSPKLKADIATTGRLGRDVSVNNAFFSWQMSQRHCEDGANARCSNSRWAEYLESSAIVKLRSELQLVVAEYLSSVGIDEASVPKFEVRVWANVQNAETTPLGIHEHTTKGNCITSGTFYTAVPSRSGALRFHDQRARMTEDMSALRLMPGDPHDHQPSVGQLLVFPPWQLHEVMPFEVFGDAYRVSWAFNAIALKPNNLAVQRMLRDIPYRGNQGLLVSGGSCDSQTDAVASDQLGNTASETIDGAKADVDVQEQPPAALDLHSAEELEAMTAKQLKALLMDMKLDVKGTKETLIKRLLSAGSAKAGGSGSQSSYDRDPGAPPLSQLLHHLHQAGIPDTQIDRAFAEGGLATLIDLLASTDNAINPE